METELMYKFNRANNITLPKVFELANKLDSVTGSIGDLKLNSIQEVMKFYKANTDKGKKFIKSFYIDHFTRSPKAYDIVLICCNYCTTEDNPTSPISAEKLNLEQAEQVVWGVLETVFKKKG